MKRRYFIQGKPIKHDPNLHVSPEIRAMRDRMQRTKEQIIAKVLKA